MTTTFGYTGDKLTSFGGATIAYNSMGCPVSYNGKNYVWANGKLSRIYCGNSTQAGTLYEDSSYTYNGFGQRIRKYYAYDPNPGSTSDYSYSYNTTYNYDHLGRLIREYCTERYIGGNVTTREFVFLYDESGMVGVMYSLNGAAATRYHYQRNLQGDVVALYDENGTRKVEYSYDAWGNCTVIYGAGLDIAKANPIRYRGYYYDRETGLYYCNARYYNPQWRRFLSPATRKINPNAVNSLNTYVYANNNPINSNLVRSNTNGNSSWGINAKAMGGALPSLQLNSRAGHKFDLSWLANTIDTGSTVHGVYSSAASVYTHISYFAQNLYAFSDDMTMIGSSVKDGILAFNQFSWGLGGADIFGIFLGTGLDIYDSYQRGVSTGGIILGGALTAAKGVGLIYLNKGILYASTSIGSAIYLGAGTVVGFAVGAVICIVVDIFVGGWIDDLIDSIIK